MHWSNASSESYLKIPNIIAAAEITNSDAIHPGYGFLSENAQFSRVCRENGIKFIGASPENIEAMGDKASAKQTMHDAGVPTIPGSEGLLQDLDHALKTAREIGYPVMMKATAGGGGKGMRVCLNDDDVRDAWEKTRVVKQERHSAMTACTWRSSLKNRATSKSKLQAIRTAKHVTFLSATALFSAVTRNLLKKPVALHDR